MSGSDDRAELATWRRGRSSGFWLALRTVAAVVLVVAAFDAHANVRGPGSAMVGTVFGLGILAAIMAPVALVGAAALYGAYRLFAWGYDLRSCIHPRWRFLFWAVLLSGSAAYFLGAVFRESEAAVLSATMLFFSSVIGLLVTETSRTIER